MRNFPSLRIWLTMGAHSFVLCVEGGGVDPSPKAWQVLEQGAIPIIRSHSLTEAYRRHPVVIAPDWASEHISAEKLQHWRAQRAPLFAAGSGQRAAKAAAQAQHRFLVGRYSGGLGGQASVMFRTRNEFL